MYDHNYGEGHCVLMGKAKGSLSHGEESEHTSLKWWYFLLLNLCCSIVESLISYTDWFKSL